MSTPTPATNKVKDEVDNEKPVITPLMVSEAPPPKENIWDKRKQELSMRETPSPPTTGEPAPADKHSEGANVQETKATNSTAKESGM